MSLEDPRSSELDERIGDAAPLAFRVAYAVLRHRQDAEDVAQEALAKAVRGFARLRNRDRFRSWIVRVSFRAALDRRRSERRRERREQAAEAAPGPTVEDLASAQERRQRLLRALDELPEGLRLVVVLVSLEGHDVSEAARLLELPEGTVKSRLHRARKELLEKLRCLASGSRRS